MRIVVFGPERRGGGWGGGQNVDLDRARGQLLGGGPGERGGPLLSAEGSVKLHPPYANPGAPIACMGANYIGHTAAMRARSGDMRSDEEVRAELRKGGLSGGSAEGGHRPVGGFWKLTDTM